MLHTNKEKDLHDYGFKNLVMELNKMDMQKDKKDIVYTEAITPDVIKLENTGDIAEGIYVDYEESKQYSNSFVLKLNINNTPKIVFVSPILIDKLRINNIMSGQMIKIEFLGKKITIDGKRKYNDYKLFYEKH